MKSNGGLLLVGAAATAGAVALAFSSRKSGERSDATAEHVEPIHEIATSKALPPAPPPIIATPLPSEPKALLNRAKVEEDPKHLMAIAKKLKDNGDTKSARIVVKKATTPVHTARVKRLYALIVRSLHRKHPDAKPGEIKDKAMATVMVIKERRHHVSHAVTKLKSEKKVETKQANIHEHRIKQVQHTTAGEETIEKLLISPINGVSNEAWTKYVHVMKVADPSFISKTGELGAFLFSIKRLADLGLVSNVARISIDRGKAVWRGEWTTPVTEAIFLSSLPLQTNIFAKSMSAINSKIYESELLPKAFNQLIDNKPITLSGLLALAHRGGYHGMLHWLANPTKRAQFPNTNEAIKAANAIF